VIASALKKGRKMWRIKKKGIKKKTDGEASISPGERMIAYKVARKDKKILVGEIPI